MKMQVKIAEQVYEVEVGDLNARPIVATVEGETFEVWPEEKAVVASAAVVSAPSAPAPAPVAVAAAPVVAAAGGKSVGAPIPGVITAVKVKVGDAVKQGQELLSLEAMKMNNAVRAPKAGTIAAIHVNVGDHVRHNQALIDFAD